MKKKFKKAFIAFGGLVVAFILGTLLVLPLFSKQEDFDIGDITGIDKSSSGIADSPSGEEPFLYEYFSPPSNSFGIGETTFKFVNESFWQNWTNDTVEWVLEKSVNGATWNDCSYLLNIDKLYDDVNISYKYTLNWTTEDKQYYRLIKRTNLSSNMSSYRDMGGQNKYLLNFSFDSGEKYNTIFNWSDYENSSYADISSTNYLIKVSNTQLFFEFIITSDAKLNNGQFVSVDPTFGQTGTGSTQVLTTNIGDGRNYMLASNGTASDGDGTADNITIKTATMNSNVLTQCVLYEYVAWNDAGNVIAYTEEKTILSTEDNTDIVFNFNDPKPSITDDTIYWLVVAARECVDVKNYIVDATSGNSKLYKYNTCPYVNLTDDPMTGETTANYPIYIYCSYTVSAGNNPPTLSGEDPYNDSTGVAVTPDLYVVCTDTDAADTMNVTWRYNVSDNWYDFATNTSVSSGTNITQNNANFTNYSALYYWSINCSDGTDWTNETYHFTTVDPDWNNIATVFGNYTNNTLHRNIATIFGNYTNNTLHRNIDTIFGNYSNNTLYRNVVTIFGNYTNDTALYNNIATIYGNYTNNTLYRNIATVYGNYTNNTLYRNIATIFGNYTNTTLHRNIATIYGNYTNTTGVPNWNNIATVFGNYTNNTLYRNVVTIFGNYTNDTALYNNIATIYGNYTNTTVLPSWNNIATIYGNYTNDTAMWNNIVTIFGNYTNTTVQYITITNVYPGNNSFDIPLQPNVYALFNSTNGSTLNISWYYGSQGLENTLLGVDVNVTNGTHSELFYAAVNYSTLFYWRIQADDGHRWVNESFDFRTDSDITMLPSGGSNVGIIGAVGVFGILGFIFVIMNNQKKKKKNRYDEHDEYWR